MMINKKNLIIAISILFITSCSRVATINMKTHSFNNYPETLIFIQIPGLSEEHLAYLHFKNPNIEAKTELENYACFGKMWNYNMMNLTPSIEDSLLSQKTGYPLSDKSCKKYNRDTLWDTLATSGYQSATIYHEGSPDIKKALKCNKDFYSNTRVFFSDIKKPNKSSEEFHFQQKKKYENGKFYYDKSCKGKECISNSTENLDHILDSMKDTNRKFVNIVDYKLFNILNRKDVKSFASYMSALNTFLANIRKRHGDKEDYLVVLSSTSPKSIDWKKINKKWPRMGVSTKSESKIMSPVWADGALSENFCGVYLESDLHKRFFWKSTDTTLPF